MPETDTDPVPIAKVPAKVTATVPVVFVIVADAVEMLTVLERATVTRLAVVSVQLFAPRYVPETLMTPLAVPTARFPEKVAVITLFVSVTVAAAAESVTPVARVSV